MCVHVWRGVGSGESTAHFGCRAAISGDREDAVFLTCNLPCSKFEAVPWL